MPSDPGQPRSATAEKALPEHSANIVAEVAGQDSEALVVLVSVAPGVSAPFPISAGDQAELSAPPAGSCRCLLAS